MSLFIEEEDFDSLELEELMSEDEDYFNILFPTEQAWEDCMSGEDCLSWEVI